LGKRRGNTKCDYQDERDGFFNHISSLF
jgi:hypothetical protein